MCLFEELFKNDRGKSDQRGFFSLKKSERDYYLNNDYDDLYQIKSDNYDADHFSLDELEDDDYFFDDDKEE